LSRKRRQRNGQRSVVDITWNNFFKERGSIGFSNNPSTVQQTRTEQIYIRILSEMCMSRFTWENLPKSVKPRYIEKVLYAQALVVFFHHKATGVHLALRGSGNGNWNIYDDPTSYLVNSNMIINETILAKDCVPIWGNYMRMPDVDIVLLYAMKLAQIDRSMEIVSSNMRTSRMITATQDQLLTYQNINQQIDEGVKAIFLKEAVDAENIKAHDMQTDPRYLPALATYKVQTWNEALTYLGVENNAGEDKKERLVSDEVDAGNDSTLLRRASSLKARQEACEEINDKFRYPDGQKLNIKVRYANDLVIPKMPGMLGGFSDA
jgi:hypothetical protein